MCDSYTCVCQAYMIHGSVTDIRAKSTMVQGVKSHFANLSPDPMCSNAFMVTPFRLQSDRMLPSGLVIIVSLVATTFGGANGEP
jgi:hypothetical protein